MIAESTVEEAALSWLGDLGYSILHGPEIAPGELFAERQSYQAGILSRRLRDVLGSPFPAVAGPPTPPPDIILFLSGCAIGVISLKTPSDASATIWSAFNQLQTY